MEGYGCTDCQVIVHLDLDLNNGGLSIGLGLGQSVAHGVYVAGGQSSKGDGSLAAVGDAVSTVGVVAAAVLSRDDSGEDKGNGDGEELHVDDLVVVVVKSTEESGCRLEVMEVKMRE